MLLLLGVFGLKKWSWGVTCSYTVLTQVYGMFLESLARFIDEHREYLDDWLFLMLLRLLHRHGTDMLSSVNFKLQVVLELVRWALFGNNSDTTNSIMCIICLFSLIDRKSFDADAQFSVMCRILTDQTQPMNHKVKLGWLEYMQDLLSMLDSADFRDVTGADWTPLLHVHLLPCLIICVCFFVCVFVEIRQAMSKLLELTTEPRSAEIRKHSQKVVVGMFELNPATFTLMLRNIPKSLQESANKILKLHMQEMSSSSGEESDKEQSPKRTRKKLGGNSHTPVSRRVNKPCLLLFGENHILLFKLSFCQYCCLKEKNDILLYFFPDSWCHTQY